MFSFNTVMWILGIVFACAVVVLGVLLFKAKKDFRAMGVYRTDDVTGIGNRKYIRMCYDNRIDKTYRTKYYLMYIALDIMKIEKHYGVEKSNDIQRMAASVIKRVTNEFEFCSRYDNGIFICIFRCFDPAHAIDKANNIVEILNRNETDIIKEKRAHFRVGIYRLTLKKEGFETAFTRAKLGYIHASENKINACICTEEMLKNEALRNRLQEKLSHAIDENQFEVYLQFIYNVNKKKFTGAEVLSRWNSPEEGLLTPAYYINDMRKSGIIDRFDYYMLDKVCKLLEEFKANGINDVRVSCNITRITISGNDFLENLLNIVNKYDFRHEDLTLEITEDALIDNSAMAYQNIVDCKNEGFKIALDDFGAGHSSVSDLCDYPVDVIKVDRHIIMKSVTKRGEDLLQGLVNLAHRLDIEVLCEGVETKEENRIALNNGCDFIQGYYYSYVLPLKEAKEFYEKNKK